MRVERVRVSGHRPCSLGNKPGLILNVKEVLSEGLKMECDPRTKYIAAINPLRTHSPRLQVSCWTQRTRSLRLEVLHDTYMGTLRCSLR